jgi:predicted Zn-dependent protease
MTGAYTAAIRLLKKIKRISGDLPGIYFLLASAYLHSGKKTEARKALTVAAMLDDELFEDYAIILPEEMLTPAMKRLFSKTK